MMLSVTNQEEEIEIYVKSRLGVIEVKSLVKYWRLNL
jgi:hypothetical protein